MSRIEVNSGSDRDIKLIFPADMRPVASPALINVDARIADRLTVTLLDGAAGEVNVFLEGTDPMPLGDYVFAVQITKSDGNTEATEKVVIRVR